MRRLGFALLLSFGCSGAIGPDAPGGPTPEGAAGAGGISAGPRPPAGGGSGGTGTPSGPAASCAPPPARIWRLTPAQYARTVLASVPAAADVFKDLEAAGVKRKHAFSNPIGSLDLSEPYVTELFDVATAVADQALATPGQLAPCLVDKAADPACVRTVAQSLADKTFRRPVATAEIDGLMAFWQEQAKAHAAPVATRLLVQRILLAPDAVFRTELGPAAREAGAKTVTLTADERASALSYLFTDGPPDAVLVAAAKEGRLASSAGLAAEARRLAKQPAAAIGVKTLMAELFGLHDVATARKDPAVFAAFTAALAADMSREADLFVEETLWKADARLSTLLAADFTVMNGALAKFYGVQAAADQPFKRTPAPTARGGVLTLPAMMARLGRENDTDPVARGKFILENLLCQKLPSPPGNLDIIPPPPDGKRTQRERLAQHSVGDCAPCHAQMDPLGLAFETLDGIGKHRTMEAGKTIDTKGTATIGRMSNVAFADGVELSRALAGSPDVAACFVKKAFEYAHGAPDTAADACAIERLTKAFEASKGDILELLVALASDDSFFTRSVP